MFLSEHERHDEALVMWKKAASLNPNEFDVVFNLATAHRQVGNNGEAVKHYERAAKLSPQVRSQTEKLTQLSSKK